MREWDDALERQMDIAAFWRSRDTIDRLMAEADDDIRELGRLNIAAFGEMEAQAIEDSAPIFVTDEMRALADVAALSFQPEPLLPTDLLMPNGLAHFAAEAGPDRIRTLSWTATTWECRDPNCPNHHEGVELRVYGDEIDDAANFQWPFERSLDQLLHPDQHDDEFGMTLEPDGRGLDEDDIWRIWRFAQAFFRLLQQRITVHSTYRPSRPSRRRAERRGISSEILVVTLRRAKSTPTQGHADVEWSHRWIVGGHWRNQWFPSLGGHRQMWISPYIKGPEEKELRVRPKVFVLAR